MELAELPAISKYLPLALAIAFIVQGVKSIPYFESWFAPGPDGKTPKAGATLMLVLPFALGLTATYAMSAAGDNGDPFIRGICAGGMSSFVYDIYTKLMKKKSDGASTTAP